MVCCLFLLLFNIVVDISDHTSYSFPLAENGVLDIQDIELATTAPVPLSGEWQFYWQQLITPGEIDESHSSFELTHIPQIWNDSSKNSVQLPATGYATYRLTVNISSSEKVLALSVPIMSSAYKLFVDGDLVDSAGRIGTNKNESTPEYSPKIIVFEAPNSAIEIVLQISNYDLAWGGLWLPITLSTAEQLFQAQLREQIRSAAISAIFFTIAVLSLFHFTLRPSDFTPFILALSCICLGLREVETSQLLFTTDAISLGFNTTLRVNFLTFYLAIPLFTTYFHLSYPKEFKRIPLLIITFLCALFSLATLLTEPKVYSEFLPYFQYLTIVILIYGLFSVFLAAYRRRRGARTMLLGALLLFIFAGNDVMHSLGIIQTGYISSFGFLSFILFQNYMTYVRFIQDGLDKVSLSLKANHDPLTSLLNRRGLLEAIELTTSNKRNKTDHFSIMLIDFDHFKNLNDTLGHDVGDQVLAEGGKIMIELIREYDLAVRWGGEEFVIVLPNTKLQGAITLAEKIRISLNENLSEKVQHPITASFGVAENFPQESLTDCLKRADIALYKAKNAGRNRVVAAELEQTEVKV